MYLTCASVLSRVSCHPVTLSAPVDDRSVAGRDVRAEDQELPSQRDERRRERTKFGKPESTVPRYACGPPCSFHWSVTDLPAG